LSDDPDGLDPAMSEIRLSESDAKSLVAFLKAL